MSKLRLIGTSFLVFMILLAGCSGQKEKTDNKQKTNQETIGTDPENSSNDTQNASLPAETVNKPASETNQQEVKKPNQTLPSQKEDSIQVVAQPESIPVLVNKLNKLPDNYTPSDIMTTTIPFINTATAEKRKMRKEAAEALAKLFAGAKQQGLSLLGVSAYRSHATQTALFNYYVKVDGYEKARNYSALPGTSEHETGLAIDVTGGNGKCAADDCFGGTVEANWLQAHASDYGFIIRYPKGKETITGYKYEPWHIRYVGTTIAKGIMERGITLEEYYNAVPVNN